MITERESMTLNEMGARALGVEERSDETPRARASGARPAPDPEVVSSPPSIDSNLEEADRARSPARSDGCFAVHLPPVGLAQSASSRLVAGPDPEQARCQARRAQPARCEGARTRGQRARQLRTAHRSWKCREKLPGCWDSLSDGTNSDGGPRARLTGRCGPSVPSAGGVTGHLLPSSQGPGHQQRSTPARALCESEREHVLKSLSPAEVVATLSMKANTCARSADVSVLAANQPVRERRHQLEHPPYTKPELVETWSWDITRLLGPTRWSYFYLYVLLAGGWMVAERECRNADRETCLARHLALRPRGAHDQQMHRATPPSHAR